MLKVWIPVGLIVIVALLWVGGELHRQTCVQEHRTGCSVLPWVAGGEVVGPPSLSGSSYLLPSNGYLLDNARKSLWP